MGLSEGHGVLAAAYVSHTAEQHNHDNYAPHAQNKVHQQGKKIAVVPVVDFQRYCRLVFAKTLVVRVYKCGDGIFVFGSVGSDYYNLLDVVMNYYFIPAPFFISELGDVVVYVYCRHFSFFDFIYKLVNGHFRCRRQKPEHYEGKQQHHYSEKDKHPNFALVFQLTPPKAHKSLLSNIITKTRVFNK